MNHDDDISIELHLLQDICLIIINFRYHRIQYLCWTKYHLIESVYSNVMVALIRHDCPIYEYSSKHIRVWDRNDDIPKWHISFRIRFDRIIYLSNSKQYNSFRSTRYNYWTSKPRERSWRDIIHSLQISLTVHQWRFEDMNWVNHAWII